MLDGTTRFPRLLPGDLLPSTDLLATTIDCDCSQFPLYDFQAPNQLPGLVFQSHGFPAVGLQSVHQSAPSRLLLTIIVSWHANPPSPS